jgi:biotin--protein ligase
LPEGFPASKIVFVQYLFALAVCEALDDNGKLGVRIKWPNDIYAEAEGLGEAQGTIGKGKVKIGGILITTSFHKGQWKVIVGTGINVLNSAPTTSLSKLHQMACERYARSGRTDLSDLGPKPTMEGSLAKMLVAFEQLWDRFLEAKGFEPFLDEYLGRWLHKYVLYASPPAT